jgi:hypothetical protein
MNCKEFNELLKEYLSGTIDSYDLDRLKKHLESCDECRSAFLEIEKINAAFDNIPDLELPSDTNHVLDEMIHQESLATARGKRFIGISQRILIPAGIAASIILFMAGFLTGRTQRENHLKDQEILALRQEVNETKNLMILNLINQQSASKRILAATYAEEVDVLNPEVMNALLNSLNNDYSANVRLASLEALAKYTDDPNIRLELVKTFDNEKDPIIQLNMINLMVLLNEKSSVQIMQRLVNDDLTPETVKEQAKKGLEVLL